MQTAMRSATTATTGMAMQPTERISDKMIAVLRLLRREGGFAYQSRILESVWNLKPEGRVRPRAGRYFSSQAKRYQSSRAALTRTARRLEQRGLVNRIPGYAGRAGLELSAVGAEFIRSRMREAS